MLVNHLFYYFSSITIRIMIINIIMLWNFTYYSLENHIYNLIENGGYTANTHNTDSDPGRLGRMTQPPPLYSPPCLTHLSSLLTQHETNK